VCFRTWRHNQTLKKREGKVLHDLADCIPGMSLTSSYTSVVICTVACCGREAFLKLLSLVLLSDRPVNLRRVTRTARKVIT
jgi:hypothetical protein